MRALIAIAALVVVLSPAPAGAHGEIGSTTPERGATLQKAPRKVSVTFTEEPTDDSRLKVLDGCRKQVVDTVVLHDATLTAQLEDGQPGRWKVSFDVISAEDGHPTSESFTFTVAGKRDCSTESEPVESPTPEIGTGTGRVTPGPGEGDDGGFPAVPVGIGAGALMLGALAVRLFTGRKA